MKNKNSYKYSLIALLLVAVNACADDSFKKSLDVYCNLYSPESLSKAGDHADVQTVYGNLLSQQKLLIKNKKLSDILTTADKSGFVNFYHSVKNQVEKELGRSWECPNFDLFFMPRQKVVSITLNGINSKQIDPQSDSVITIMLTNSGDLLLNNAPLQGMSKLKPAIISLVAKDKIKTKQFVLYFDQGSNGEFISDILSVLTELGVTSVDLIDL